MNPRPSRTSPGLAAVTSAPTAAPSVPPAAPSEPPAPPTYSLANLPAAIMEDGKIPIVMTEYSKIPVWEYSCRGVAVMRRRADSWLNATQILKVAGVEKGQRTKILEREILSGRHEKVQGGYGKYQGTWMPFDTGVDLARRYGVEHLLTPILSFSSNGEGGLVSTLFIEAPSTKVATVTPASLRKQYLQDLAATGSGGGSGATGASAAGHPHTNGGAHAASSPDTGNGPSGGTKRRTRGYKDDSAPHPHHGHGHADAAQHQAQAQAQAQQAVQAQAAVAQAQAQAAHQAHHGGAPPHSGHGGYHSMLPPSTASGAAAHGALPPYGAEAHVANAASGAGAAGRHARSHPHAALHHGGMRSPTPSSGPYGEYASASRLMGAPHGGSGSSGPGGGGGRAAVIDDADCTHNESQFFGAHVPHINGPLISRQLLTAESGETPETASAAAAATTGGRAADPVITAARLPTLASALTGAAGGGMAAAAEGAYDGRGGLAAPLDSRSDRAAHADDASHAQGLHGADAEDAASRGAADLEQYKHLLIAPFVQPDPNVIPLPLTKEYDARDFDINMALDDLGNTTCHWAAAFARLAILERAIARGADVHRVNHTSHSALMRAVMMPTNYESQSFPRLLQMLASTLHHTDITGRTVLHHTCLLAGLRGRADAATYYLECLKDYAAVTPPGHLHTLLDVRDRNGDSALNIAARIGRPRLAKILIEMGADINLPNKAGLVPSDFGVLDDVIAASRNVALGQPKRHPAFSAAAASALSSLNGSEARTPLEGHASGPGHLGASEPTASPSAAAAALAAPAAAAPATTASSSSSSQLLSVSAATTAVAARRNGPTETTFPGLYVPHEPAAVDVDAHAIPGPNGVNDPNWILKQYKIALERLNAGDVLSQSQQLAETQLQLRRMTQELARVRRENRMLIQKQQQLPKLQRQIAKLQALLTQLTSSDQKLVERLPSKEGATTGGAATAGSAKRPRLNTWTGRPDATPELPEHLRHFAPQVPEALARGDAPTSEPPLEGASTHEATETRAQLEALRDAFQKQLQRHQQLLDHVMALEDEAVQSESRSRRILAACCGIAEEDIDAILGELLEAVQQDRASNATDIARYYVERLHQRAST